MNRRLNPRPALRPVYGAEATGVAGWLGLLWLSLVFLLPGLAALGAIRVYSRPGLVLLPDEIFRSLVIVQWSAAAATAALCWFLAWRLSQRPVWRSVEIVVAGLWVYAVVIKGGQFVGLSIVSATPLSAMIERGWTSLALPALFAAVWTAYLLRSQRVARTYQRHEPVREIAGAFD
jgi:hypothetical protein